MLSVYNLNEDPTRIIYSPSSSSFSLSSIAENKCYSKSGIKRKQEKLYHLTEEEKVIRRKLKNRISAQTARDRKKKKLNSLEEKVTDLIKEKLQLMETILSLKNINTQLESENEELKKKLLQLGDNSFKSIETNQSDNTFKSDELMGL